MDEGCIPYTPELAPALVAVWNAASGGGLPLTARLWEQQVARHPLFRSADCLIVPAPGGGVAGFAVTRRLTAADVAGAPELARDQGRGHIMALAVHPAWQRQGIGGRLLGAAEAQLHSAGARTLVLGAGPGHLVPGPPVEGGTPAFWERAGYRVGPVAHDLRRRLDDWTAPPPPPAVAAGDFVYRQGRPGEEPAILAFLAATFPGGWRYLVAQAFAGGYRPADLTLLCDRAGAIAGFLCGFHEQSAVLGGNTFWYPLLAPGAWGGVGPLGVSPAVRGQSLGLGLVAAGVDHLHRRGVRDCCIDWTGLTGFYGRLGFQPWKGYYLLEKAAGGADI